MKFYDNLDNFKNRTHTIRVTLQCGEYKGHVAFEVGGNCFGLDLLHWNFDMDANDDISMYLENDCEFSIDEENDIYLYKLKDEEGNVCIFEDDENDLSRNIVAIEIIDCKVEENKL